MIVFDTSIIVLSIDPASKPPIDPGTGATVFKCKERIDHLIETLGKSRTRILIPTPVLSEFLIKAGPNKHKFVKDFLENRNFLVGPFDQRAAIELAELIDPDLASGKSLNQNQTKAKVKFDRQIVAISKIHRANCLYTDDVKLGKVAHANGMKVVMTWEIPLSPEDSQGGLFSDSPESGSGEQEVGGGFPKI